MAKRILLADDSITIQKVVELTFSDGDYEVTAVNNGSKAIQKLSEMRPDIILSDIIMPEKNGYEVCEFVKSHPEFRAIPVILLTGTFEPFDPDRADKAGCDAVVTKPFESQSLIHRVEELIQQAASQTPAAPEPAPAPAEPPFAPPADTFATNAFQAQSSDIFSAPPSTSPFDETPAVGETKAFPRMSFDELQKMANEPAAAPPPPPPPAPEASPWDETPATGGETKAFPRMSFEEMQQMATTPPPAPASEPPPVAPEPSPWDSSPAATEPKPAPRAAPEPASPWDDAPAATGGETRAFPRMSFEDVQPQPEPAVAEAPATSPAAAMPGDLTEEQIERIARRVVQLMSQELIKNIAWEVIPDMAEMVVKERIRQLETEA